MTRKIATMFAGAVVVLAFLPRAAGAGTAPAIQSPAAGSILPGGGVRARGVASNGATVDLVDTASQRAVATTTASGSDGSWSATVPLGDGSWTVYAVERIGEIASSAPSSSVSFTVDAVRPSAPNVATPAESAAVKPGTVARVAGTATDDRAVFAVQLEYWLVNKLVRRVNATCSCDGATATWRDDFRPDVPGYYVAKASTYDRAGNKSAASSVGFFTLNSSALPDLPDTGALPVPPAILSPDAGAILPGGGTTTRVSGTAMPGRRVQLFATDAGSDVRRSTTTVANSRTGAWTAAYRLDDGAYTVSARTIDRNGRMSPASAAVTFFIDATRPGVRIETASDDIPQTFLPGQPVEIRGTASDNRSLSVVRLDYWYLDKLVLRETAVCACRTRTRAAWMDRPDLSLPGYYHVVVSAIDAAGNGAVAQTVTFIKAA